MSTDFTATTPRETITPIIGGYIAATPGSCDGEPRIAGTRIKVRHVYTWVEQQGMSVAQVVEQYPHLTVRLFTRHWLTTGLTPKKFTERSPKETSSSTNSRPNTVHR
jgi:uncharacterized protein (DUF433 family)